MKGFFPEQIRKDFPILNTKVGKYPLVYLDNAATTQKPLSVINSQSFFYQTSNANIHRGSHFLGEKATLCYENARETIRSYLSLKPQEDLIFTRGTTESINLVSSSISSFINEGDEILITQMEHHANIVPWQMLAKTNKANLKVCPVTDDGQIDINDFKNLLNKKVKLVSFCYASNVLGTVNEVKELANLAKKNGSLVLVDAAQAIAHCKVDFTDINCDFLAFSGHKVFAPTGIGVLIAKKDILEEMSPYQGGGDMIENVTFEKTTFAKSPAKFEAGTPNIAGAYGLAEAFNYLKKIDFEASFAHDEALINYTLEKLRQINGVNILANPKKRLGVISFNVKNIHSNDISTMLNYDGIAIRVGNHCAQPLHARFGLKTSARVSFSIYNTLDEVDIFIESLKRAIKIFS